MSCHATIGIIVANTTEGPENQKRIVLILTCYLECKGCQTLPVFFVEVVLSCLVRE